MNAHVHAVCFGRLFPSGEGNQNTGVVFTYVDAHPGVITSRAAVRDLTAWDRCAECAEFDPCYASLLLRY